MTAVRIVSRRLLRDQRGATAIEYGLIIALIAAACIGAFSSMGGGANGMWTKIANNIQSAG